MGRPARKHRAVRQEVAWVAAAPANDSRLWTAILVSLLVHGALLGVSFKYPDASRAFRDRALDIILVNSKSAHKPSDAQALAQTNLDGGGNTKEDRRAKSPLPPSRKAQDGNELEQTQQRVRDLEAKQRRLLAQARGKNAVAPATESPPTQADAAPATEISGRDLATRALAMAKLEAEVAQKADEYNKWPRKKNIGTRADEYRFARYVEDWRLKIERVGTLNYPEEARGKLYGSLVLSVTIKSDGTIDRVEINRSSGKKVLDDAARRIVMMAGAAPFPPNIRQDTDIVEITRNWTFTSGNTLETSSR